MATENQKKVVKIIARNIGKGRKISVSEAMKESGVYAESMTENPQRLTNSQGYKELMERYLPDLLLDTIHSQLLTAKHLDQIIFPADSNLTDEEIQDLVESSFGCALKKISRGERAIYVFFYAPDNRARKDALDMAFKRKGRYAPLRVYTEPDPLEELPDEELSKSLAEAEAELIRRNPNARQKSKIAPKKHQAKT